MLIFFKSANQKFQEVKVAAQPFTLRLRFDIFDDRFEMVKEQLTANKKTGEELSLSIIANGYKVDGSGTVDCVVVIKRKRIVSETAKNKK